MALKDSLNNMNNSINNFFAFVTNKLKQYPTLSVGEKVAYPTAGTGLVLMLVSLVLFII